MQTQSMSRKAEQSLQILADKVDDLENSTRRNNLRVVGLPESVKPAELQNICEEIIPKALGIHRKMVVERAHCIGAAHKSRRGPRQVITRYLIYNDKSLLLQKLRNKRDLCVYGQELHLFSDYSAKVSRRRKQFSKICSQLHQQQIKFTLAFPANFHLMAPNGKQYTFFDLENAEAFLSGLEQETEQISPTHTPRAHGLPQWINRKLISIPNLSKPRRHQK